MTVFALTRSPQRLRGVLSRFCLEVQAGLFIGRLDARMRDSLWEKVEQLAGVNTRAVMAWRERNEQGYAFRTLGEQSRMPALMDGIWIIAEYPEGVAPPIDNPPIFPTSTLPIE